MVFTNLRVLLKVDRKTLLAVLDLTAEGRRFRFPYMQ
jgi:hypothetical protein